jgi:enoyl-CoA hydratase/carnithine racemase
VTPGAPADAAELLCEIRNHVATVTLNRPAALNALSYGIIQGLHATMREYARDANIRAVLIKGAGDKAFCAGGDIRALYQSVKSAGSLHQVYFAAEYLLDFDLYTFPKPYIALLDGITMGGGMGIAQSSRLRIVGERTRMAMPEVAIGLFPDVGGSYFLSRLAGALGPYLALTGTQIRAADALYTGLADLYLPAAAIGRIAPALESLDWGEEAHADAARALKALSAAEPPAPSLSAWRPAIDTHFAKPTIPEILESLQAEIRPDYADWARQTAALMRTRSPTMLAVTLRQLQRGRTMTLAQCLRMELNMMQQCFVHGDLLEGARATIIEKDNAPHWRPERIEDVTDAMVQAFFVDRWTQAEHPLAGLDGV